MNQGTWGWCNFSFFFLFPFFSGSLCTRTLASTTISGCTDRRMHWHAIGDWTAWNASFKMLFSLVPLSHISHAPTLTTSPPPRTHARARLAGMAGSTFWAPVINLAREPRWGRNIEVGKRFRLFCKPVFCQHVCPTTSFNSDVRRFRPSRLPGEDHCHVLTCAADVAIAF